MSRGWIGVDLDATLAIHDGYKGPLYIGAPIAPMVERVKQWLAEGREVRILTARVGIQGHFTTTVEECRAAIEQWCLEHIGTVLPVTCSKDYMMLELWDDRAVQVEPNTGEPVTYWQSRVQ